MLRRIPTLIVLVLLLGSWFLVWAAGFDPGDAEGAGRRDVAIHWAVVSSLLAAVALFVPRTPAAVMTALAALGLVMLWLADSGVITFF